MSGLSTKLLLNSTQDLHGQRRIIVFVRYPDPGKAKTRLIPSLGPENAAQIHLALARHTIQVVERIATQCACDIEIRYTGGDLASIKGILGPKYHYQVQLGDDLSERLTEALHSAFDGSARHVLVIGTDCPELCAKTLTAAFDALQHSNIVVGPAADGGYYLIGMRSHQPQLFVDIDWGTERVLAQTELAAKKSGQRIKRLPTLNDVDFAEDLIHCRKVGQNFSSVLPAIQPGLLSIIIPTLNEEATIEAVAQSALAADRVEVLVADGGSSDRTIERATAVGCRIICCNRGRSRQMNTGAALASGEILLFLHADTLLPPRYDELVRQSLAGISVAGAFRLQFDSPKHSLRYVAWGANVRSRLRQLPYGDQAPFLRAETFFQLGGYRNWPIFEDYELAQRLRRKGTLELLPAAVVSSARRQLRIGVMQSVLLNQMFVLAFRLGFSPNHIAQWYRLLRNIPDTTPRAV